ncbi:MAG: NAD(P)/FAD-dependent oxidoreductase, partial [Planctomycetaceae bacterium]|nr:NAD(P)/FAD-dependent oxidoreductase [Planctomycetaceae bacterium]
QSVGSFREAMVTAGGIALSEIDRQTMESRKVPGLFFAGEVLDVDGDTGGFNLQFAFSSGFLAGKSASLAS